LLEAGIEADGTASPIVIALGAKLASLTALKTELENGTVSRAFGALVSELGMP